MLSSNSVLQERYLIVRQLGHGGMGAVYEAIDQRFKRTVAVKEAHFSSESLDRAFEREARLLNGLRHDALPIVWDYFTEGDRKFLVMDFVPGKDLWQLLQERSAPFPVRDVVEWADQLLDALEYLHGQTPPILHRDIKPQNIKLSPEGTVKLLDFGLSKGGSSQMTADSSFPGFSPHYAPLEQIQDRGTTARSDLYALGATLYTLLTLSVPPDAIRRATELLNGRRDPLLAADALNSFIPPHVVQVLSSALDLHQERRPGSAAQMRAALADEDATARLAVADLRPTSPGQLLEPQRSLASTTIVEGGSRVTSLAEAVTRKLVSRALPPLRERTAAARRHPIAVVTATLLIVAAMGVVGSTLKPTTRVATIANIDVVLDNVPPGLVATGVAPSKASINVRGPADALLDLRIESLERTKSVRAAVDCSRYAEGVHSGVLSLRGLPEEVELESIDPLSVRIRLEPLEITKVEVEPRLIGQLSEGYRLTGVSVAPQYVTIRGARSSFSRFDRIPTTAIDLTNRFKSFEAPVTIDVSDTNVWTDDQVVVGVRIEEDFETREFSVPVTASGGGQVEPASVNVLLRGPSRALNQLSASDITAVARPTGAGSRKSVVPQIQVSGPAGSRVAVESIQPSHVRWKR